MGIMSFNDFINESWEDIEPGADKNAAGVAIVWQDSILLVHPSDASWKKSAFGIPKGGIEPGEDPMDAAIRELEEETGIVVKPGQLEPEPLVAHNYNQSGKLKWQLIYFVMRIQDPSEVGIIDGTKISKDQLQKEEIDWAGFVPIDSAYPKMHRSQLIILDRLR